MVKNTSNQLVTDEIDARVWGTSLVDGSGANTYVAYWTDANTISGEAAYAYNAATNTLTVANINFSGEINGGGSGNLAEIDTINASTINAGEKNFDIPHPSKEGWRLRYSSLEGPERGVYVRGKVTGEGTIELPDYWKDLIYEDSITVQLTPIGSSCTHHVINVNSSQIAIGCGCGDINAFYIVHAERKYSEPVLVEYQVIR